MSKTPVVPFATTLHVRDRCLCLQVQRAARTLARRFDAALRPTGLNNGQFSLLMALNRPQPTSPGALADVLAMDRTTVTAALKPLERRGLVTIAPSPADRRGRSVRLTPAGEILLQVALPIWQAAHDALEAGLASGGTRLHGELARLNVAAQVFP
jgi:DNA-binding MarR family transcriptional regulator